MARSSFYKIDLSSRMYNVQYPMQQPPQPAPQFSAYGPAMNSSQNQPLNFPNFSVNSSTHGFFPPNYVCRSSKQFFYTFTNAYIRYIQSIQRYMYHFELEKNQRFDVQKKHI